MRRKLPRSPLKPTARSARWPWKPPAWTRPAWMSCWIRPHKRPRGNKDLKIADQTKALACAVQAARLAGGLMRRNQSVAKKINSQSRYDIKLDLDVRCQKLIEGALLDGFPGTGVLGEEALAGEAESNLRW